MPPQQALNTSALRTPPKAQRAVGTPHPRGTNFELHKQARGRWQLDAIFDDKGLAIEEAKAFLARAREQVAVRVMAVEPRETQFLEIIVFRGANDRGKGTVGKERKITTNSEVVAHGVRRGEGVSFSFAKLWRSPYVKMSAVVLALVIFFAFLSYRNAQHPYALFDSADAMKSHTVRTPWENQ